jgi:hypothetical protein
MKNAVRVRRFENFADWYQEVIRFCHVSRRLQRVARPNLLIMLSA